MNNNIYTGRTSICMENASCSSTMKVHWEWRQRTMPFKFKTKQPLTVSERLLLWAERGCIRCRRPRGSKCTRFELHPTSGREDMYNNLLLNAPPWTVGNSKGDSLESVIMSVVGAYHNIRMRYYYIWTGTSRHCRYMQYISKMLWPNDIQQ